MDVAKNVYRARFIWTFLKKLGFMIVYFPYGGHF